MGIEYKKNSRNKNVEYWKRYKQFKKNLKVAERRGVQGRKMGKEFFTNFITALCEEAKKYNPAVDFSVALEGRNKFEKIKILKAMLTEKVVRRIDLEVRASLNNIPMPT